MNLADGPSIRLMDASAMHGHMADIEIRQFTGADIGFGKLLTDAEGWHRTITDWERLMRIEPAGVLKAQIGSEAIGIGAVLTYDHVAWVHSLIIHQDHRGIGAGKALLRACLAMAEERGASTVKLDSVTGFESFYEHIGFVREFESMRFIGKDTTLQSNAERVRGADIQDISMFDKAMTGIDRQRVITEVFNDAPELAFAVRSGRRLEGYVLGRRGEMFTQIGPLVANPDDVDCARRLLVAALKGSPAGMYRVCVPGNNPDAVDLVTELGLESRLSSTRMFKGRKFEEPRAAYGMISPEKG